LNYPTIKVAVETKWAGSTHTTPESIIWDLIPRHRPPPREERNLCRHPQSASRRRAEAALWRAAKAEGLAHSMTLRAVCKSPRNASRLGLRAALRRFSSGTARFFHVV